jgi:hypothetical protein
VKAKAIRNSISKLGAEKTKEILLKILEEITDEAIRARNLDGKPKVKL